MNILLIHENRFLADDLEYFIKKDGHQCKSYHTAKEVVENLDELKKYDSILLNILMNGYGLDKEDNASELHVGEILFKKITTIHSHE